MLLHSYVTKAHDESIFQNVSSIKDFLAAIKGRNEEDKGLFFEVLGEYLIQIFGKHEDVAIERYAPNKEKDLGVDGRGVGLDGTPATVQFKLRLNPKMQVMYKELATFFASSRGRRFNVQNGRNMLVIATTYEKPHYLCYEDYPDFRFLGLAQLQYLTGNVTFWEDFREAIRCSAKIAVPRPGYQLKAHQAAAVENAQTYIYLSPETRGQIIIPCGGGKTLIECILAQSTFKSGVVVVLAPRIALVDQLVKKFDEHRSGDWGYLVVSSGEEIEKTRFLGECFRIVKPTLDTAEIEKFLQPNDRLSLAFSTYHSAHRIADALRKDGRQAELVIGDEAHNLTRQDFHQILKDLPAKHWSFFTATRRVGVSDSGRGMNNDNFFGPIIFRVSPRSLQEEGMVVPPRIHVLRINEEIDYQEKDENKRRLKQAAVLSIAGIKKHYEIAGENCKVIVFCESAADAHDLAESREIQQALPNFRLLAVTSLPERMIGKSRGSIMQDFQSAEKAVLFNYAILGEGIDIPGITGVIPLRGMNPISATQAIGRACRITTEDRESFARGQINTTSEKGWKKPFGWVIIPHVPGDMEETYERIAILIHRLREEGYEDVEKIRYDEVGQSRASQTPQFDPYQERIQNRLGFDDRAADFQDRVAHILEEIYQSGYCSYQTARKWLLENGIRNKLDFQKTVELGALPSFIPPDPENFFRIRGWGGWDNFLS